MHLELQDDADISTYVTYAMEVYFLSKFCLGDGYF